MVVVVDFFGGEFVKESFSVDEVPVLDVEVDVGECDGYQCS